MKCPEWHTSTSHSILFSSLDNCNLRALQTVFSMESIYIMYYVYICSDSLGILIGLKKSKLCEIAIKMRIRNFQFGSLNFRTRLQFYRRKSLGTGARLIMHICWRLFKVLYSRWRRYYGYQWAVLVVQTNGLGITEK